MSLVRDNLMSRPHYSPFCGLNAKCSGSWPRTIFINDQFECPSCGWRSEFDKEFIELYKVKRKELNAIRPWQLSDLY